MVHASNPSTQEAEAGEPPPGQPEPVRALSPKTNNEAAVVAAAASCVQC